MKMNLLFAAARRTQSGLTIVEMLIGGGIVSILALMTMAGFGSLTQKARKLQELNAARTLITAYTTAASDNNGQLLPGMDMSISSLTLPSGKELKGHTCQRYPYRLAAYMGYEIEGTILLKDNKKQIEKTYPAGSSMYEYIVSTFPAFGINMYFVGGTVSAQGLSDTSGECATRVSQLESPLLVFASAGIQDGSTTMRGFNFLTPPNLSMPTWSSATATSDSNPALYGNVDARHDGKAMCAFSDGSVKLLSIDELRDMRLWSKNAAAQGASGYCVPN